MSKSIGIILPEIMSFRLLKIFIPVKFGFFT
jgi:hypothetical protein